MKTIISVLFISLFINNVAAQQIKSNVKKVKITTAEFKRGLPPNLFAELSYTDNNNNGVLECEETSVLKIKITNKGKGKAQGLNVKVSDDLMDKNLIIGDNIQIARIEPNESVTVEIPIKTRFDIETNKHKLKIDVTEHFGYDMDPAFLRLSTLEYQQPKLKLSGLDIFDSGEGTMAIIADKQLQKGEMVKVKLFVQNIGTGVAENVKMKVTTSDDNIYMEENNQDIGDIKVGEVKEIWFTLSPNKRVDANGKLPIFLTLTESIGNGGINNEQLPIEFGQKPPATKIVEVDADFASIAKEVAVFEFESNKFTAPIGNNIDVTMVEPTKTKIKNSVGLIIGIEEYKYLPNAPYADNDAELMKEYFKKRLGLEQVVIYTNEQVSGYFWDDVFNTTSGELQKAIVKGKTDLYVFYSGHGVPQKDGNKVYLFPSDGKISRLDQQGYELSNFYKNLASLEAASTTVFLDACFSGASRSTQSLAIENLDGTKTGVHLNAKMPEPWNKYDNFNVFTSSSGAETSLGYDASETGLFSYFLMAGMQGEADTNNDKQITLGELKNYVIKNVSEIAPKISGKQTPQFHGDDNKVIIKM